MKTSPARPGPPLPVALVGAAVLVGVAALGAVWFLGRSANPGALGFRLDDAWIHMVYGRGLLRDGFLSYNDGIAATGCTSPLWAIVLALAHLISGGRIDALVTAVNGFGAAFHLLAVIAATQVTRRLTGGIRPAVAAGTMVALAMPFTAAAFSGMEVTMTAAFLLLTVEGAAARAWRRAGIFAALATLARPEAAVVLFGLAGWTWRNAGTDGAKGGGARSGGTARLTALRELILPSVIGGALLGAHHLWASSSVLPATFHAKSQASLADVPARLATTLRTILPGVPPFAGGVAWLALLGYLPRKGAAGPPGLHLALFGGVGFLLANLYVVDPVDP
ncbi:MAG: hypothetical protein HKN12_01050, partial [Gemmatimonadetes bacterium]|nr:hypothetical protein [Gemmatimonadota bacterium]